MATQKHMKKKTFKFSKLLHNILKLIDLAYKISKIIEFFLKFF